MTTYYVDGVDGNDSNAGTSEGSGNAWATIDKAMNTVAAGGDHVYIKGNGTYSETPNIDTAGILTSWNIFEGYTTTPGDGGKATISGTTNCLTASTASTYYLFRNIIFSGGSGDACFLNAADKCMFRNCEFVSAGGIGCKGDNNISFVNCVFANNTTYGVDVDLNAVFAGCTFYGNGSGAGNLSSGYFLYRCLAYGNSVTADVFTGDGATRGFIIGNTIDGEGTTGACVDHGSVNLPAVVADNIFYDAATAIIVGASDSTGITPVYDYNLINSCTNSYYTGSAERNTEPDNGFNDVTSAPQFTDEANDDYSLGAGSAAKGAGLEAP